MKKVWWIGLFVASFVLAATSSDGQEKDTASTETAAGWKKYDKNPVLGGSLGTCFDIGVLRDGDKYRMWFSWRPKKAIALKGGIEQIGVAIHEGEDLRLLKTAGGQVEAHPPPAPPVRTAHQCMTNPPSTLMVCPVTWAARSDDRKTIMSAMASGGCHRPSGTRARILRSAHSSYPSRSAGAA